MAPWISSNLSPADSRESEQARSALNCVWLNDFRGAFGGTDDVERHFVTASEIGAVLAGKRRIKAARHCPARSGDDIKCGNVRLMRRFKCLCLVGRDVTARLAGFGAVFDAIYPSTKFSCV